MKLEIGRFRIGIYLIHYLVVFHLHFLMLHLSFIRINKRGWQAYTGKSTFIIFLYGVLSMHYIYYYLYELFLWHISFLCVSNDYRKLLPLFVNMNI